MEYEQPQAALKVRGKRKSDILGALRSTLFADGEAIMGLQQSNLNGSAEAAARGMAARMRALIHVRCPYAECDDHLYPNRLESSDETRWCLRAVLSQERLQHPVAFAALLRDYCTWWQRQPGALKKLMDEQDWKEREEDIRAVIRRTAKINQWHRNEGSPKEITEEFCGSLKGYCGEFLCRAIIDHLLRQLRVPAEQMRLMHRTDALFETGTIPLRPESCVRPGYSYDVYVGRRGVETEWDLALTLGAKGFLFMDVTTSSDAAKEKFDILYDVASQRAKALKESEKKPDVRIPYGLVIHCCDPSIRAGRWRLQSANGPLAEHILQLPLLRSVHLLYKEVLQRLPYLRTQDAAFIERLASKAPLEKVLSSITTQEQAPLPSSPPA